MHLLMFLLIGLAAGWLASVLMKGRGMGPVVDLVVGVIGALIGGFVFGLLGLAATGLIGAVIRATLGAVILLALLKALRKA